MLQETTTWDLHQTPHGTSASMRTYMLFLFVVCVVTAIKLIRIWWGAPPFRLSRLANRSAYLQMLQASSGSLKQWLSLTFLIWGIFASMSLYDICDRLLDDGKKMGSILILFRIEDFSAALSMTLLVGLFLFLGGTSSIESKTSTTNDSGVL